MDAIIQLVDQHDVKRIVVGLPYSLDGSVGKQATKVMDFVNRLSKGTDAKIETWDERLSTVAAERLLREADNKKADTRAKRDAAAAAFILQGYLDSLKVCDQ
jgi:putative Holliday junction resolvase